MAEPKAFASLTSGLLARKGQAKPAMRPQGFNHAGAQDDLGWNDMGYARPRPVSLDEPRPYLPRPLPEVVRQQEEIAQEFAPDPVVEAEPVAAIAPVEPVAPPPVPAAAMPVAAPRSKASGKPRAAFTLRLDTERHLKLRLACAISGRSAQHIVTEALDTFLSSMPEIDTVAAQLPGGVPGTQR